MSETPTLFDDFEKSHSDNDESPVVSPAAKARYELSDEAKAQRAKQREIDQQRAEEAIKKRQDQIERAAEQGIDIRTAAEIDLAKRKQRTEEIRALREKLRENTP